MITVTVTVTTEEQADTVRAVAASFRGEPWQWKDSDPRTRPILPTGYRPIPRPLPAEPDLTECPPASMMPWNQPEPFVVPWTRETFPELPLQVVDKNTGNRKVVLAIYTAGITLPDAIMLPYDYLLKHYTLRDGSICGEVKP